MDGHGRNTGRAGAARQLKRRGLLAGAAALAGMAVGKLTGPERVEAGHSSTVGTDFADRKALHVEQSNTTAAQTRLTRTTTATGEAALKVESTASRGNALAATGGNTADANQVAGTAIVATGGQSTINSLTARGGHAIEATGGAVLDSSGGTPGNGLVATRGTVVTGTPSTTPGGVGVRAIGGAGGQVGVSAFALSAARRMCPGVSEGSGWRRPEGSDRSAA